MKSATGSIRAGRGRLGRAMARAGVGVLTVASTLAVAPSALADPGDDATTIPEIDKTAAVASGPNTGSTTEAGAGDTVEWTISFDGNAAYEADGVTVSDPITGPHTYLPGSLDVPPGWTPEWSTDGGTTWTATEPAAGTNGVRATHPTNGLPAAVGGTVDFPTPPASAAAQAGTGGDGYDPIPFGTRVYNIFHHQFARVYCTEKATGAACYTGGSSRYLVTTPGTTLSATAVTGTDYVVVSNRLRGYIDPATQHLWVAGQVVTHNVAVRSTGGWVCADLSMTPPQSCSGTAFVTATTALVGGNASQGVFGDLDFDPATGRMYAGDGVGGIYCFDTTTGAICPGTWPITPGFSGGNNFVTSALFNGRVIEGTNRLIAHRANGASDELACIDMAAATECADWATNPVQIDNTGFAQRGAPFPIRTPALVPTLICSFLGDQSTGVDSIVCRSLADGTPAAVPAQLPAAFPPGATNRREFGWNNTGDWTTSGSRTFFPLRDFAASVDQVGCWDDATQAACGSPWPLTITGTRPYALRTDDLQPTCIWELGDAGILRSFDSVSAGTCSNTTARVSVDPADFYCSAAAPTISGWDRLVLHNVGGDDFTGASVTLFDQNGAPIPGFDGLDVTTALQPDPAVLDISALAYPAVSAITAELELRGVDGTIFSQPVPPSLNLTWDGAPIETCFRTVVAPVCVDRPETIANAATLDVVPATGTFTPQTATATLDYELVAGSCPPLVFGKLVTAGPTPVAGSPDTYDLTYQLSVRNPGAAVTEYDLSDQLQFGGNVSIVAPGASVTNVTPGGLTPLAWDGVGLTQIVDDQAIAAGATHVWQITVRVSYPATVATDPATDCDLEGGETGTGLRNQSALAEPNNPTQIAVACRPTGVPQVAKSGVVVDGPNTGSTTTAQAGDVIEWKVQFQNSPDVPGTGVDITDAIGTGQTYVPGSLEVPGPAWAGTYSSTPGSTDPADFAPAAPEPAGVEGVGMRHPTNGLPSAVGGSVEFPPPPASQSGQAGTGGDGYAPIPVGANVYNVFHHQTARLYCTVKATGARCAGYPATGLYLRPLAPAGTPLVAQAGLAPGDAMMMVANSAEVYDDRANSRLWIGGQLYVLPDPITAVVASTGRIGFACIELSVSPPANCGWVESFDNAHPLNAALNGGNLQARFESVAPWVQGGQLLGFNAANAPAFGPQTIYCLDVVAQAPCASFATGLLVPTSVTASNMDLVQVGATSRFLAIAHTAAVAQVTCYDAATTARCSGWPTTPVTLTRPAGPPNVTHLWAGVTTYDPAMNATGVCWTWQYVGNAAPSPPASACVESATGAEVPAPPGWGSLFPAGNGWLATLGVHGATSLVGTRTFLSLHNFTNNDSSVGCYDWAAQAPCGGLWPLNPRPVDRAPYANVPDDVDPNCIWELGHNGVLISFDATTGGPCSSTTASITVEPVDYYCASSDPTILGWDELVLRGVGGDDFGAATLTLLDENGDPIPGWDDVDVTAALQGDPAAIDISSIDFAVFDVITVELELRTVDGTIFGADPPPSFDVTWVGDPVEMCFRTVVEAVCDIDSVDNLAAMAYQQIGGGLQEETASHSFEYIATGTECFALTKTVTGRTYEGDGRWRITYDVGVTNNAVAEGRYDLADELRFGAGITVVPPATVTNTVPGALPTEPGWTGTPPNTSVTIGQGITAGATHTYQVSVLAEVPPDVAATAADCTLGADPGTGFLNTATLSGDGDPLTADACEVPLFPTIDLDKVAESVVFDSGTGQYVVTYRLTAAASGEGLGQYDITDTLAFGPTTTIVSAEVAADPPTPGAPVVAGWSGVAPDTLAVDDAVLDAGDSHAYTVTVRARYAAPPGGTAGSCVAGEDFANDATLTPLVGPPVDAAACIEGPLATVTQTKALDGAAVFDPVTDLWTIEYLVTETAVGTGQAFYTLDDELLYGPTMDVISAVATADTPGTPTPSPTWDGEGDLRVVTDAAIDGGQSHVYRMTVQVDLTGQPTGTMGACIAGEDFFNRATVTTPFGTESDDACDEPGLPNVVLDKEEVSVTYDSTTLTYTITYDLSVVANGDGEAFYTLVDALDYGANMVITGASVVPAAPGTPAPLPGWDGQAATTVVANAPIGGGDSHRWTATVTAQVLVPPAVDDGTCDAGDDFFNSATLTITGRLPLTDETCSRPVVPTVSHDKRLVGSVFAGGQWTITYAIDVVATVSGTGFYDLADEFDFGDHITVVGVPSLTAPAGVTPDPNWDGTTVTGIVDDQAIAGGATHTYTIDVVATVVNPPAPGECLAGEDFHNESTLTTADGSATDDACAEPLLPALAIAKAPVGVTFDTTTGEYVTTYTVTVSATGDDAGNRSYDLSDTLDFPANVTIGTTSVTADPDTIALETWTGQQGGTLVAGSVNIETGETHVYTFVVRSTLASADPAPNDPAQCTPGQDFVNRVQLVAGADVLDDNACLERVQAPVDHTKTLSGVELDPATGMYTLTYELEVTAGGDPAGQTFYDLTDTFDFGPNITIEDTRVGSTDPDPLDGLVTGWNGASEPLLVDDQLIATGDDPHVITVEVDLTIDAPVAENDPALCAPGVDLHNDATLTVGAQPPATASACAELPVVTSAKEVLSGPTPVDGEPGHYTVGYRLTVSETVDGLLAAPYDLVDQFRFGSEVTVIGAPVVITDPDPLAGLQPEWNGATDTLLVDNGTLDPGETETLDVTVVVESLQPDPADPDQLPCSTLDEDLANQSTLTSNGDSVPADACAPVPHPAITHTKTVVDFSPNGDGTHTVQYSVAVTNAGTGAGLYDLADEFQFGAGVAVVGDPTVEVVPDTVTTVDGWNGTTATSLADDQPIDSESSHTFTITVVVTLDGETTTGTATDCTLDGGEDGTGLRNVATLDPGTGPADVIACEEVADVDFAKQALDAVPNPDGSYTITYELVVTNDGSAPASYDLTDQLRYGDGITVQSTDVVNIDPGDIDTNEDWDGIDDVDVAADATITGGGTHVYTATVVATPDAELTVGGATDCTLMEDEDGTGFRNEAGVDSAGREIAANACEPVSAMRHAKVLTAVTPNGDGSSTAVYTLTVTNLAADPDTYDLTDELRYGAGVTVQSATVANTAPGTVDVNEVWNGTSDTAVAEQVAIDGSPDPTNPAAHVYTVSVRFTPDQTATAGPATDCELDAGESGTGILNQSTMTTDAGPTERQACGELPHLTITKALDGQPTIGSAGVYAARYTITVANDGAGAGTYDLRDTLRYGSGIEVRSTSVANTAPGGILTNQGWNGRSDTTVTSDTVIEPGSNHTYAVTVSAAATSARTAASGDCTLGAGEGGTGLMNTAVVHSNGRELNDDACSPVAPPPSGSAGSNLVRTGWAMVETAQLGLVLLFLGVYMLALRRRRSAPGRGAGA